MLHLHSISAIAMEQKVVRKFVSEIEALRIVILCADITTEWKYLYSFGITRFPTDI